MAGRHWKRARPTSRGTVRNHWRRGFVAAAAAVGLVVAGGGGAVAAPASGRLLQAGGAVPPFTYPISDGWSTTWSYNLFSPSFMGFFDGIVVLPLAIQRPPKLDSFIPELASSWSITPSAITVHLRPNARWQNGAPVTGKDVVTASVLLGVSGGGPFAVASSIDTPNQKTVVFHLRHGEPADTAAATILNTSPAPSGVYGRLVTSSLEQEVSNYAALSAANPNAAPSSGPGRAIAALSKKLAAVSKSLDAFQPKKLIGDGPYRLDRMNGSAASMTKWSGFWDAKDIRIKAISFLNVATNADVYPLAFDGRADYETEGVPWTVVQHELKTPGGHYLTTPNFSQYALYFNERHYPLGLLPVRQALAYLFNRPEMGSLEDSGHSSNHWIRYPDGLLSSVERNYLSASQIASLNPYRFSKSEATKLLERAGLHKGATGWILPDGKPFTLTIGTPAGWGEEELLGEAFSAVLTRFGIKTTANAEEQPGYWTDQTDGNFELDWGWGASGLDPLTEFTAVLGSQDFASPTERGLAFGPVVSVPGLGRVNVHNTITQEADSVGSKQALSRLTWDWARLVNEQVPYLSYADKNTQFFYSTEHYVDWPAKGSWLWSLEGYTYMGGLLVMMQHGYLRPKA